MEAEIEALLRDSSRLRREGRDSESRAKLDAAIERLDTSPDRNSVEAIEPLLRIASELHALAPLRRDPIPLTLERQAYEIAVSQLPESDPRVRRTLSQYSSTLSDWGRYEEARRMLERCIQLVEAAGCNPKSMNFHLNELGLLLMKMGLYREAVPVLRRAQSLIIEHENALYRLATASLGGALVNLGQFREAFELLEPIQRRRVEHRGEVPQDEITEWFNKAKEAVDSAPKRKPKARSGHPKKKR